MGHNPSRYATKRLQLQQQLEVDEYKARSIWGRWWQLDPEFRARLFSQEEIRWVRRYGARLDELANLAIAPRNDQEKHFVEVAAHGKLPHTERERLWLRVQMACRFEECIAKAALCNQALDAAAGLDAEARQLRIDMRDAEELAMELQEELALVRGEPQAMRRRSLCNVTQATLLFQTMHDGPAPLRTLLDVMHRGSPHQTFPACLQPSAQ